jgi:hypothetical protein
MDTSFCQDRTSLVLRVATTAAHKLLSNWEAQGLQMNQWIAYLVKSYSILESMFVNTNQTSIHLVPTGGAHTWDKKGTKHI